MSNAKRSHATNGNDDEAGTTGGVTVAGRRFDLIARCPVGGSWVAWVRHASADRSAAALPHPLLVNGRPVPSVAEFVGEVRSTGPTAAAALRTLADAIRAALGEESQADPDDGRRST